MDTTEDSTTTGRSDIAAARFRAAMMRPAFWTALDEVLVGFDEDAPEVVVDTALGRAVAAAMASPDLWGGEGVMEVRPGLFMLFGGAAPGGTGVV